MTTIRAECERVLKLASEATPGHFDPDAPRKTTCDEDVSPEMALMLYAAEVAPALAAALLSKLDECERLEAKVRELEISNAR